MKTNIVVALLFTLCQLWLSAQEPIKPIEPSYFNLTTSNGMIVAVYDAKEHQVDYVYPHIFEAYDSAKNVHPFACNIRLNSEDRPTAASYLGNTHVIQVTYDGFTVSYFASFLNSDEIFYAVISGDKQMIRDLSFSSVSGDGKILSGIPLLQNAYEDKGIHLSGNMLSGSTMRPYAKNIYEKYILFSFTDSLHKDTEIVIKALARIASQKTSLLDDEVNYMRKVFSSCKIPANLTAKERNVVEQSISMLKMAQVSDKEIFPLSRGQVIASLRPGLWHATWVRDGSYAIQAMTRLGLYNEARKGLEFMLKAKAGRYKHFIFKDGKDYGVGSDYQITVCRYFGIGKEESTYGNGPNIEFDNFGLFLWTYADFVKSSMDTAFYRKWNNLVCTKVADVTVKCIDTNSLMREDSGPWEHYLEMPRQYTFTSGVCAKGLQEFAMLQQQFLQPYKNYQLAADYLKKGISAYMVIDNRYIKGNRKDKLKSDHEYFDAGVYEIFANGLISDKKLFTSHMEECDKYLRIPGDRPGYIRLNSNDPYENQEWVFINLRIALAHLLYGEKIKAATLMNYITDQASVNYNTIPEMYSNKLQMAKVSNKFNDWKRWCNCFRDKDAQYIGAIPMVGYGSGAYILTILAYYAK